MSSYQNPKNAVKQRRYRIRRRMEHALLDIVIANNLLAERDQAHVFESLRDSMEREQFHHVVSELFDFLLANLSVGDRNSCAPLGIAKALHRTSLLATGGTFDFRPTVDIQTPDTMRPSEFDHEADIARYLADQERVLEGQPKSLPSASEFPDDPPASDGDLYASPLENRGHDREEATHDNRAEVYQRRIEYLKLLGEWEI